MTNTHFSLRSVRINLKKNQKTLANILINAVLSNIALDLQVFTLTYTIKCSSLISIPSNSRKSFYHQDCSNIKNLV